MQQSGGWTFSVRRHSTTVGPDRETVCAFDLEGRPISWFERGRVFKRSLAGDVVTRERASGRRRHGRLDSGDAASRIDAMLATIGSAPVDGLDAALLDRLNGILRWTADALAAERSRFDAVYRPVSILPPDQYMSIVLQASFGCSWNRCTFCNFYQDRPFETRTADEFRDHAGQVLEFLGRGAELRRGLFLADGNALILSNARLRPLFDVARRTFPGRPVSGFVDVFGGERKSVDDWRELRELGLERVSVGVETGHDPLLRWIGKPGGRDEARAFIETLKEAGLSVSAIVMTGAGGDRFAAGHVQDTLDLIAALPLGRADIVYLSPFVEHPDSEYARRSAESGVQPLAIEEAHRQYARLRDGIRRAHECIKVARYDIREFLY